MVFSQETFNLEKGSNQKSKDKYNKALRAALTHMFLKTATHQFADFSEKIIVSELISSSRFIIDSKTYKTTITDLIR